jgi:predicted nucleic acid-binding protein
MRIAVSEHNQRSAPPPMIHLDTNVLIGLLTGHPVRAQVRQIQLEGGGFACSAVVWTEFLNGPADAPSVRLVESFLEGRILPFEREDAALAARLFNATGRKRGLRFDCMVAASALRRGDSLLTLNREDFDPFAKIGLTLA